MSRGVLGVAGAGAVGTALARLLLAAGWRAGGVACRTPESAERAVRRIGGGHAVRDGGEAARGADLLLLTVPDRAIREVAEAVAAATTLHRGALALHCSGALSSDALAPLRPGGACVGSLHPLQTFTGAEGAEERVRKSFLFYEGDDPDRIRAVALDLGGRPVLIRPEGKVLYHAGAAAACNLGVAMVDLGVRLMSAAGIDRQEALKALLPLLRGTVSSLAAVGLPAALTGPVARGDVETVAGHLAAIDAGFPELLTTYAQATRHAVRIASEGGGLAPDAARAILTALDRCSQPPRAAGC
ncbi:MAG: DUF2520 domain-containing protein [Planctomycetes bacterium]|nr:DUF2520 domain-containing protein [Planctomycetota bacterium]